MAKRAAQGGTSFTIKVQALLKELAFMRDVEDHRTAIPVLHNLSIVTESPTALKLTATDLDVTLTCQAEAARLGQARRFQ